MGARAVEPERVVPGDGRTRAQGSGGPGHTVAGGTVQRAVAQDAKPHDGHRVARRGQRGDLSRRGCFGHPRVGNGGELEPRGDEAAGPETGLGELRDRLDERASQEAVAERQRTPVVLHAVGAPNAGQPFFVEEGRHGPVGIGPTAGRLGSPRRLGVAQAAHDPGLQHGGRGDDPLVAVGARGLVGHVDRVGVPHRLHPVTDHGGVDGVRRQLRRARLASDERLEFDAAIGKGSRSCKCPTHRCGRRIPEARRTEATGARATGARSRPRRCWSSGLSSRNIRIPPGAGLAIAADRQAPAAPAGHHNRGPIRANRPQGPVRNRNRRRAARTRRPRTCAYDH